MQTMAESFQLLITQPDVFPAIQQALKVIGKSSRQDRAYFFDLRQEGPKGTWLSSQRCEWSDPSVSVELKNPALQNIRMERVLPRVLERMLANKIYEGVVRELSPDEQALLRPQGIISLLILPVYGSRGILGFIGFDNCRVEYPWSAVERSMLQGTAAAIGAALDRHEASLLLRERVRSVFINFSKIFRMYRCKGIERMERSSIGIGLRKRCMAILGRKRCGKRSTTSLSRRRCTRSCARI
jgi:hypothetical protein